MAFSGVRFVAVAISDLTRHDTAPAAPGELELLQRFLNLHVHDEQDRHVDPPLEMLQAFLAERGLLRDGERVTEADRQTYLRLRSAIRDMIEAGSGAPVSRRHAKTLDEIAVDASLHPHFHAARPATLEPSGSGMAAAFGTMVSIAFVSTFDGSFDHLRLCADETCRAIFYDRSKNHSGRWCSMATCGNRAKVRAWRERRRTEA